MGVDPLSVVIAPQVVQCRGSSCSESFWSNVSDVRANMSATGRGSNYTKLRYIFYLMLDIDEDQQGGVKGGSVLYGGEVDPHRSGALQ